MDDEKEITKAAETVIAAAKTVEEAAKTVIAAAKEVEERIHAHELEHNISKENLVEPIKEAIVNSDITEKTVEEIKEKIIEKLDPLPVVAEETPIQPEQKTIEVAEEIPVSEVVEEVVKEEVEKIDEVKE